MSGWRVFGWCRLTRPPPAHPVGRQQALPDGDEVLLEIEEAKCLPVAGLLERRPHIDAEVEVNDRAQDRGEEYRTTMALANAAAARVRKRPKNEPGRARRGCPCRERLVGDRAEERDRHQTMNDYRTVTMIAPASPPRVYLNSSTVANGSADHGRKRLSVNFVFWPGFTSTRT